MEPSYGQLTKESELRSSNLKKPPQTPFLTDGIRFGLSWMSQAKPQPQLKGSVNPIRLHINLILLCVINLFTSGDDDLASDAEWLNCHLVQHSFKDVRPELERT